MKKQIYLLVLVSSLLNLAYAQQFTPQFTGLGTAASASPYHMVAVDENTLWASSSSPGVGKFDAVPNLITHTEDGGLTWEIGTLPADNPNDLYIACISAVGPDSAWVSCIENDSDFPNWELKVFATFDGGNNWQIQNVPFTDNQNYGGQIHFFDYMEGIIFAGNTDGYFQVFKTYDGGNNWERLPEGNFPPISGNEFDLDDGYYAIQDTIWTGTNKGRILKSIDRGTTWTAQQTPAPSNSFIFEVTFSNSQYGIARYTTNGDWYSKKLIVTTDGGETWSMLTPQGLEVKIFDLNSIPNEPGEYLCTSYLSNPINSNILFSSNDNGATWTELEQVILPGRIALFNSEIGWISEIASNTPDIDIYKREETITQNEEVNIGGLSISPNPFKEELLINNDPKSNLESITIFDCLGQKIYSKTIATSTQAYLEDLGFLLPGVYFLSIKVKEGLVTKKIIKE